MAYKCVAHCIVDSALWSSGRSLMKNHLPSSIDTPPDRTPQSVSLLAILSGLSDASISDEDSIRRDRSKGIVAGNNGWSGFFRLFCSQKGDEFISIVIDRSGTSEFNEAFRQQFRHDRRRSPDFREMQLLLQ